MKLSRLWFKLFYSIMNKGLFRVREKVVGAYRLHYFIVSSFPTCPIHSWLLSLKNENVTWDKIKLLINFPPNHIQWDHVSPVCDSH